MNEHEGKKSKIFAAKATFIKNVFIQNCTIFDR